MTPPTLNPEAQHAEETTLVAMHVGDETYGVEVDRVHTVILPQPITAVPRTEDHILGVINLRGRVVPILDLRTRFGLPVAPDGPHADRRIVMVDVDGEHVGMVVDGVSEVMRVPQGAFAPPPESVFTGEGYVRAVVRPPSQEATENAGRLLLMLDVNGVVHGSERGGC